MAEVERLRRSRPERTGPQRSFVDLAQRAGVGAAGPGREDEATPGPSPSGEPGDSGPAGAVNLGYRVIEDYLQQGRQAARLMGTSPAGSLGLGGFQDLSERLLRDGILWLELMAKAWATLDPPAPAASASSVQRGGGAPEPNVRVRIASAAPAEVRLELRPDAAQCELRAQDLHSLDRSAPAIEGVGLVRSGEDGTLRVDVRVPDSAPAGVYSGTVVDAEDGAVRGTIAVLVSPLESAE